MARSDNCYEDKARLFETVPEGQYAVEVADVEEKETCAGDILWRLSLRVTEGPHAGTIIFDNLVFSKKGMPKALAMFKATGLPISNGRDYYSSEVNGRKCQVTTYIKDYTDGKGLTRNSNEVPFTGYGPPVETNGGQSDGPN